MKLILENWNKFLNEEKKGAYSFDYDETLIKYKTDPEDPEFSTIYDKPHEENIAKLRELAAAGETVYIVTSRSKRTGDKYPWDTAPEPEELVADMNLPVKSVHYTNGDLKAETLLSLGVIEHWDDDEEEIAAAKEAGIKANFVPGDQQIRETMLSMWANKLQEAGVEPSPKMKKYLKDHPYMEPDGLQERCQKGYKTHPKRKTKKMYGKTYRNCIKAEEGKDPSTGTGKKPKGSGRRLYTDEDPSDTVSVKFRTVQDVKDTLSKKSFKSKSHKRQSQIINLIHQRVRAAYQNAKDPKTKARLKKVLDHAEKRKEASKEKTKRLQKKKD